jgi:hypothetical protein
MDDNHPLLPSQLSFEDTTYKNMFNFVCNYKVTFHFPYKLRKQSHIIFG